MNSKIVSNTLRMGALLALCTCGHQAAVAQEQPALNNLTEQSRQIEPHVRKKLLDKVDIAATSDSFQYQRNDKSVYKQREHAWFHDAKDNIENRIDSIPLLGDIRNAPDVDIDIWRLRASFDASSAVNAGMEYLWDEKVLSDKEKIQLHFVRDMEDVMDGRDMRSSSGVLLQYTIELN